MVPTGTGKPGKMGSHFPVREKSGNFVKTGIVRENCRPVIVRTLQIWYHTLNKKRTLKILEKFKTNTGKVRKICQSEKGGTMEK